MISEKRVKELILDSLKNVKSSDPVYKDWVLDENTVALGTKSSMDSVAFTTFVTELEENIEKEIGSPYELDLAGLYGDKDPGVTNFSVRDLANRISSALPS